MDRLAIVVPCYNEEAVFDDTNIALTLLLKDLIEKKKINSKSFILYVNDGSNDDTWQLIKEAYNESKYVYGLSLASNKGHQNALFAGLMYAKDEADFTISIDADLQDDIFAIEEMIDKYNEGIDIVYGVRNDRTKDSFFKRFTAESFYKLMKFLDPKTINNHADFRLLSKRVLEELSLYSESHLFLRGIVTELGFKSDYVYYERKARLKGKSKYPLSKMLQLAFNGITSFSDKPLKLILYIGLAAIIFSISLIIYSLIRHFSGQTITGWTSMFASIWFIGGVQLVCLGIIGQYLGKTYIETKKRPRYYIDEYLTHTKKTKEKK